ncbi:hypothetical protein H257_08138 [Aphanomyces astaci]|uniref:Uncharacterized protein n=1 Tax=Aphanomyces astaci TaxID=112090 RepID=W4GG37_APHAT|nr:hypothetical protein H257_08138 [Aphanomyces astaci]ETV78647.1 hypothetical protein H257_08138 [Aphanomyces astaci]|eukprot:XP_009832228.1 hypothetical protein H257_08138 [Aphanomyces astaci]
MQSGEPRPEARWPHDTEDSRPVDDDVLKNYRFTNDYRVVNSMTKPKTGDGVFYLPKCFWQFPLHEDSWDMLSFMLNFCVYTPDRVMQGHVDSALYKFFDRVEHFGFKLSSSKTKVYTHEVKWCGRIISGEGVKRDPEPIHYLCAIPYPMNAGDLQQFTVNPLQQCLTKSLEGKGKKIRITSGVHLELLDGEKKAFEAVKSKLRASVELSHPCDDATMCLKEAYSIARACEKLNYL